jgi:hypothetical protein
VWDTDQEGLSVRIRPSGVKTFEVQYRHEGKLRWYKIERFGRIGLGEARIHARKVIAKAALGQDPQAEKMARRIGDTLSAIYPRYLEQKSSENKSWRQADKLMRRYVLPKLGGRKAKDITKQDMWALFDSLHDRPVLANSVMSAASAMFS